MPCGHTLNCYCKKNITYVEATWKERYGWNNMRYICARWWYAFKRRSFFSSVDLKFVLNHVLFLSLLMHLSLFFLFEQKTNLTRQNIKMFPFLPVKENITRVHETSGFEEISTLGCNYYRLAFIVFSWRTWIIKCGMGQIWGNVLFTRYLHINLYLRFKIVGIFCNIK